ncbi:MAG: ribbon-helix-helix domain-containing protein [Thermoproteota archaeon]
MQKPVKSKVILIRFGEDELQKIDSLLGKTGLRSRSEFIREAVQHYLENVAEMRVIELRDVSKDQAKKEILEYIKKRKEAETFDIANDLRLDLNLTMKALKELWEEGRIG